MGMVAGFEIMSRLLEWLWSDDSLSCSVPACVAAAGPMSTESKVCCGHEFHNQ